MEYFSNLNYLAVVVSAIVYFVISSLWYSPVLFSKTWIKETGVSMGGDGKSFPILPMLEQLFSSIIYAIGIALILRFIGKTGIFEGVFAGLIVSVFFIFPSNSGNLFFTKKYFFSY